MGELGVKILMAYLLGALLGSLILGKLRGVDIRSLGSGNAGATNAVRTQGKWFGLWVLLIDIGKGVFAVLWLPQAVLPGIGIDPFVAREWLTLACAFAVIVGHVYPVWFAFRGGKGAATVVGAVAAVEPRLLFPLVITWSIVLVCTGYVGLASMVAGVVLAAAVFIWFPADGPLQCFCAGIALFVLYTHRSNIARLRAGTENRVRRLWLFRPTA